MSVTWRDVDTGRVLAVIRRAKTTHPESGEAQDSAIVAALATLVDDIRHETAAAVGEAVLEAAGKALTLKTNSFMTPDRLRRMLNEPSTSQEQAELKAEWAAQGFEDVKFSTMTPTPKPVAVEACADDLIRVVNDVIGACGPNGLDDSVRDYFIKALTELTSRKS